MSTLSNKEKMERFKQLVEQQIRGRWNEGREGMFPDECVKACFSTFIPREYYTVLCIGEENLYKIGQEGGIEYIVDFRSKNKKCGTLDTINSYYWGNKRPELIKE